MSYWFYIHRSFFPIVKILSDEYSQVLPNPSFITLKTTDCQNFDEYSQDLHNPSFVALKAKTNWLPFWQSWERKLAHNLSNGLPYLYWICKLPHKGGFVLQVYQITTAWTLWLECEYADFFGTISYQNTVQYSWLQDYLFI